MEEVTTESCLKWKKKTCFLSRVDRNKSRSRHIIIKLQKFKEKEQKHLKTPERKDRLLLNEETMTIRIIGVNYQEQ